MNRAHAGSLDRPNRRAIIDGLQSVLRTRTQWNGATWTVDRLDANQVHVGATFYDAATTQAMA